MSSPQPFKPLTKATVLDVLTKNLAEYDRTKGKLKKIGLRADTLIIQALRQFQLDLQNEHDFPQSKFVDIIMRPAEAGSATHTVLTGIRKQILTTTTQRLAFQVLNENNQLLDNYYFREILLENETSAPKPGLYNCEHEAFRECFFALTQNERHQQGNLSAEQFWNSLTEKEQAMFFDLYRITCVDKHQPHPKELSTTLAFDKPITEVYKEFDISAKHWALAGVIGSGGPNKDKRVAVSTEDLNKIFKHAMTEKVQTLKTKGILSAEENVLYYIVAPLTSCTLNWKERYDDCERVRKNYLSNSLYPTLFFVPNPLVDIIVQYDTLASGDNNLSTHYLTR